MKRDDERFKEMVESSPDWFWEFDAQANFTYVSPRIRDLLGYQPEELLGQNAFDLMDPAEAERVHKHFDPIAKKYLPFNNLINVNLHKDGHEVIIESSGTPVFDERGRFRGYRGIDRDITAQRRAEKAFRASEERFKNIVDTSSEWIWEMDLAGHHIYSNRSLRELLGYDPDVFAQKEYAEFLHPEDLLQVQKRLPRLIAEKQGWTGWVLRWRHVDGSYRYLESNAKPILNSVGEIIGFSGADRDVTERKLMDEALRKSQDLLAQTQQLAEVGSWQYDFADDRLTWSEETYRIFGVDPDFEVTLAGFFTLVHPEDRDAVDKAYSTSVQEGHESYEIGHRIVRRSTDEVRYVQEKCRHERDADGNVVRSIGMVQDVTERKVNEVALLAATQAAQAANRAKSLFLAKMSHELRTPMTAIIGFGELLEDTALSSEQRHYLGLINSSSKALSALINDVLDLSKVDAGELTLRSTAFNLEELLRKVLSMQDKPLAKKDLASTLTMGEGIPETLLGDSLRIQQILLNLLSNAVKFTEQGRVSLSALLAEGGESTVVLDIAVSDTGVGIPQEMQEQIFEPFVQADPSQHNVNSAGLGLTISRSLATLMGGTIRLESQVGVGSTFHLILPLQTAGDRRTQARPPKETPRQWRGPALDILLAEDNPLNIQYISAILQPMGHYITVVTDGKAAFEILKSHRFDVVLMDIQMPVMNGVDALSALRQLEQFSGKAATVVAITAYALQGDREKYLNLGFDGYLSKPFTSREMIEELSRVVPTAR